MSIENYDYENECYCGYNHYGCDCCFCEVCDFHEFDCICENGPTKVAKYRWSDQFMEIGDKVLYENSVWFVVYFDLTEYTTFIQNDSDYKEIHHSDLKLADNQE